MEPGLLMSSLLTKLRSTSSTAPVVDRGGVSGGGGGGYIVKTFLPSAGIIS